MADTTGKGAGEAEDAEAQTTPADGEETPEEHAAAINAKLREGADAALASAEAKVEMLKSHLEGAEKALEDAKAARADLGDE